MFLCPQIDGSTVIPPRTKNSFLTRLSSVASQKFALGLVSKLPSNSCSYNPVEPVKSWVSMQVPVGRNTNISSQKDPICHIDNCVGRLPRWLSHDFIVLLVVWYCRLMFSVIGIETKWW